MDLPSLRSMRWRRTVAGVLIAEVVLIAAAFAWVAVYSHLINPGADIAVYRQHAQASGPWVSISVGLPLFFALGYWWARDLPHAVLLVVLYLALDSALLLGAGGLAPMPIGLVALSYLSKVAACLAGAALARRRAAPA